DPAPRPRGHVAPGHGLDGGRSRGWYRVRLGVGRDHVWLVVRYPGARRAHLDRGGRATPGGGGHCVLATRSSRQPYLAPGDTARRVTNGASARGPVHGTAAQQMQMQVEDALAGVGADVENGAVALGEAAVPGDGGGAELEFAEQRGVLWTGLGEAGNVSFRHQQDVGGGAGLDVLERVEALV